MLPLLSLIMFCYRLFSTNKNTKVATVSSRTIHDVYKRNLDVDNSVYYPKETEDFKDCDIVFGLLVSTLKDEKYTLVTPILSHYIVNWAKFLFP